MNREKDRWTWFTTLRVKFHPESLHLPIELEKGDGGRGKVDWRKKLKKNCTKKEEILKRIKTKKKCRSRRESE